MEKVVRVFFFVLFLFLILDGQASAATRNEYNIALALNDDLVVFPDGKPFVSNSTTYVPVRQLAEAIGGTLTVSKDMIEITKNNLSLQILRTEQIAITSSQLQLPIHIVMRHGRTYAPLRLLGENFGYKVEYINEGPFVRLTNGDEIYSKEILLEKIKTSIKDFYNVTNKTPIYITFDDGPNTYTNKILDILKAKNAKATFFMLEPNMKRYSKEVKRIVSEGHYPALHSVSHNKVKLYDRNSINIALEMEQTRKTLFQITNLDSKLTRVPYGSKPYMKQAYRDSLVKYKFKMWDWNIDSQDWKYQKSNPKQILKNVKDGLKRFENSKEPIVILFHESKGTVSILPELIDFIMSKGYELESYNSNKHVFVNFWKDIRL